MDIYLDFAPRRSSLTARPQRSRNGPHALLQMHAVGTSTSHVGPQTL
jgi:hypothetical protein